MGQNKKFILPEKWCVQGTGENCNDSLKAYNKHWFFKNVPQVHKGGAWSFDEVHKYTIDIKAGVQFFSGSTDEILITKEQFCSHFNNNNKNEVHGQIKKSRSPGYAGSRALREKIKFTRGSRFIGSRVSNRRQRGRVVSIKISGRKLLID